MNWNGFKTKSFAAEWRGKKVGAATLGITTFSITTLRKTIKKTLSISKTNQI
jgi:hypothetical protein